MVGKGGFQNAAYRNRGGPVEKRPGHFFDDLMMQAWHLRSPLGTVCRKAGSQREYCQSVPSGNPHGGRLGMSTIRGSAHYEGLLPIEPSDEPPPIRPTILEDPFHNGQPPLRKRASRALSRFLAIFCVGVGTTLAWQSYA